MTFFNRLHFYQCIIDSFSFSFLLTSTSYSYVQCPSLSPFLFVLFIHIMPISTGSFGICFLAQAQILRLFIACLICWISLGYFHPFLNLA